MLDGTSYIQAKHNQAIEYLIQNNLLYDKDSCSVELDKVDEFDQLRVIKYQLLQGRYPLDFIGESSLYNDITSQLIAFIDEASSSNAYALAELMTKALVETHKIQLEEDIDRMLPEVKQSIDEGWEESFYG